MLPGKKIIAADIGGTNARFALFNLDDHDELTLLSKHQVATNDFSSFAELLDELLDEITPHLLPHGLEAVSRATLAVAGPPQAGVRAYLPNVPWKIDLTTVSSISTKGWVLINDFAAQGLAIYAPAIRQNIKQYLSGEPEENGPCAVVGAGTGLGKTAVIKANHSLYAVASEGGHTTLPIETKEEAQFIEFIKDKLKVPYAIIEHAVSGKGLSLIHEFLTGTVLEPSEIAKLFATPDGGNTLLWFSRFFGRVCRNYALEVVATGGVFIAGGIAAKNPQILEQPVFKNSFRESHKHSALLAKIPVYLFENELSGLWGAAVHAASRSTQ